MKETTKKIKSIANTLRVKNKISHNTWEYITTNEFFCDYLMSFVSCDIEIMNETDVLTALDLFFHNIFPANVYSKDKFISILNDIEKLVRLDEATRKLFRASDFDNIEADFMKPSYSASVGLITNMLSTMYFDKENNHIDYYCWETDFGKKDLRMWDNSTNAEFLFTNAEEVFDLIAIGYFLEKEDAI